MVRKDCQQKARPAGRPVGSEESPALCLEGHDPASLPPGLRWLAGDFSSFEGAFFYQLLALRQEVFILEQKCFYLDADGIDLEPTTEHLCLLKDSEVDASPIAYLRIYDGAHQGDPVAITPFKIGRVLVARPWRGQGLGGAIMREAIERCTRRRRKASITLSAQAYLERFYQELGFERSGAPFDDAGIPHIPMKRDPHETRRPCPHVVR